MSDPYQVLGLPADSDDEAIRRRYLELVRQFPPEKHPEKFAAVRQAYEELRDLDTRLSHQLFEAGKRETIEAIRRAEDQIDRGERIDFKQFAAEMRKKLKAG